MNVQVKQSQQLQDRFHRMFSYLRLSITEICNFRCPYCLPNGMQKKIDRQQELSFFEIKKICQSFIQLGIKKIRVTGGEPTLRKDFIKILSLLKSLEGLEQLTFTTNGYHLDRNISDYLALGIHSINISIDSLIPDQFYHFTGHRTLPKILSAIDYALSQNYTGIKINCVLQKSFQLDALESFLNYIQHRPVQVRFIELMQTGDNHVFFRAQGCTSLELIQKLATQGWVKTISQAHAGPAILYQHPDYQGKIGIIAPYSEHFCEGCNRLRVSSQGFLHTCLFSDGGVPLRPYLSQDLDDKLLTDAILKALESKKVSHDLISGLTGKTKNFSQFGG